MDYESESQSPAEPFSSIGLAMMLRLCELLLGVRER